VGLLEVGCCADGGFARRRVYGLLIDIWLIVGRGGARAGVVSA